jgi:hypothetical protein
MSYASEFLNIDASFLTDLFSNQKVDY